MSNDSRDRPFEVLLVEDDDGCALLLQKQLAVYGCGAYNVRRADRLSAALREVAQGGIDLVVLDLGLPDSQGLDALVDLRAAATDVPIVVITGVDDAELALQAVKQGAQDYVVKGQVDGPSLTRTIRYAIERFRAQQASANKHALLRSLIDSLPDQIYVKDTDSRFVFVNRVTAQFFGASTPEGLIGKSDFDILPHGLAAQFLAEEQALLHNEQPCINREAAVPGADGQTRWVLTTKVPLNDHAGRITGLLGINRDITAHRAAEEQLREYREHLEELVVQRTAELQRANERLQAQDKARSEFVSNVSHELKSPLASLRLALQNLKTGVVCPHPVRHCHAYLDRMQQISVGMQKTVEDILDMSRIDAGTLRLNHVRMPLAAMVRRVVGLLQPQMDELPLQVDVSVPEGTGFVECDCQHIERVLLNVLGNAIKFTPAGGEIRIVLRPDDGAGKFLVLHVEDTGIGVPQEHLPHIGKRYFQGNPNSPTGTGLGLWISRELLEQHGGTLTLASPPPGKEKGTRVTIRLPTVDAPEILLVGAGEPCRTLAARLARHGYRAPLLENSAEAVVAMQRAAPYAVMLDFSMAALDTAAVMAEIKGDPALQRVPLIAITEADIPATKREILAGFAIPPLKMPWHENDLFACIEQAVLRSMREG